MPHSRLIFYPENLQQAVNRASVINALTECEFIQATPCRENHYLPGDQFLSLITFLGCSPNINLSPDMGDNHCYISLLEDSDSAYCLGHTRTAKPKCPDCTRRISSWESVDWMENTLCTCDKCNSQHHYAELNWKQECGFARGGFSVAHIYPHEAVPGDTLLKILHQHTGFTWQYCYANNPEPDNAPTTT